MKTFLVIMEPEQMTEVGRILKTLGSWARLSAGCWAVEADFVDAVDLREKLLQSGAYSKMLVVEIVDMVWASYKVGPALRDWLRRV